MIVGVRTSALRMEAPILVDGELVVSGEYLAILAGIANEKFTKNKEKSDNLHRILQRSILSPPTGCEENDKRAQDIEDDDGWTIACNPNICEEIRKILCKSGDLETVREGLNE